MSNDIIVSGAEFSLGRQVPTPAELENWVCAELQKLCLADAEFTAYSVTLRLRDVNICPHSANYEISHTDIQNLVHNVLMPELSQKFNYSMVTRDWFNSRKGVTEAAQTYLPTKYLSQQLQATQNVVSSLPANSQPSTPVVQTTNNQQSFGFVIDDEE